MDAMISEWILERGFASHRQIAREHLPVVTKWINKKSAQKECSSASLSLAITGHSFINLKTDHRHTISLMIDPGCPISQH